MALSDMIPGMTDPDLKALRGNAVRLVEHGVPAQKTAAAEVLPLIDAEMAARVARNPPAPRTVAARKKAAAKKAAPAAASAA